MYSPVSPTNTLCGPSISVVGSTAADNIGDVVWLANGVVICEGTDCEPITLISTLFPDVTTVELVVQITFNDDCFTMASLRVNFFDIQKYYIPNVISEFADDPENQNWALYAKGNSVLVKTVKIYDRWGELVHDQVINEDAAGGVEKRIDLRWDGRWTEEGGPEVIPGVYVYMIEMEVDGREVIESGDITVLR